MSNQEKSQVPGWVWLFTGTALGAFIMFLMRLSEMEPSNSAGNANPLKNGKAVTEAKAKSEQAPRYDFYNVLKENRVTIPDSATDTQSTKKPTDNASYVLQVASFKSQPDAEELKIKLILLNLDARAEKVKVRNGETWHRVLVGPFTNRSALASARSILVSNNLEALVLKRKLDSK